MESSGSISHWIDRLLTGDKAAVQPLWERYFHRLVLLAHQRLRTSPRRAADEEDVALSAFDSFCRHAEQGDFPDLHDREGLWRLLVIITARKASHLLRDERRKKRGAGKAPRFLHQANYPEDAELEQILSREPGPEFAAQMAEECGRLLRSLRDSKLEAVALWKMEGYTNEEIAVKLNVVPRTIKRKLKIIRTTWKKEMRL